MQICYPLIRQKLQRINMNASKNSMVWFYGYG